jgi:hypothetical protein
MKAPRSLIASVALAAAEVEGLSAADAAPRVIRDGC